MPAPSKEVDVDQRWSPRVRRRRLGIELRRLREAQGLTIEQVAKNLEVSKPTVSRIETAHVGVRASTLRHLLDLYGVAETERDPLVALARQGREHGWWHKDSSVLPEWFEPYVGLEAEATAVRNFTIDLIPGMLQTEGYALAVYEAVRPTMADREIERGVAVRMGRQRRLAEETPPALWAVIDEAALRRPIGSPVIMRDQLLRLVDLAALANITVQVLPFRAGAHAALTCPFIVLEFENDPPVVYLETLTDGLYLDKAPEISRYTLVFDHLRASALSEQESVALMVKVAKDLEQLCR